MGTLLGALFLCDISCDICDIFAVQNVRNGVQIVRVKALKNPVFIGFSRYLRGSDFHAGSGT